MPTRISQPSHQSLFIEMQGNGHTIARGTAFVARAKIGHEFLITNRHNVTGRHQETESPLCKLTGAIPDTIVVWHNARLGLGEFVRVEVPLYKDGIPRWIEHPSYAGSVDVVALPIASNDEIALYPYCVDSLAHMRIEPSLAVNVVGFPFGERTGASFAVWATGFVASEPEVNHGGRPIFLIDCRARKGQSGSPVIRYHNGGGCVTHDNGVEVVGLISQFLGVYSGRINEDSDLGIVWKSFIVSELLVYASTLVPASPVITPGNVNARQPFAVPIRL